MDIPPSSGFPSNECIDPSFYERINDVLTMAHKPQNASLKGYWWYTTECFRVLDWWKNSRRMAGIWNHLFQSRARFAAISSNSHLNFLAVYWPKSTGMTPYLLLSKPCRFWVGRMSKDHQIWEWYLFSHRMKSELDKRSLRSKPMSNSFREPFLDLLVHRRFGTGSFNQWPWLRNLNGRYLPYIRPILKGYLKGYTPQMWPCMVQYLQWTPGSISWKDRSSPVISSLLQFFVVSLAGIQTERLCKSLWKWFADHPIRVYHYTVQLQAAHLAHSHLTTFTFRQDKLPLDTSLFFLAVRAFWSGFKPTQKRSVQSSAREARFWPIHSRYTSSACQAARWDSGEW